jgi:2',3'-cyclic-nucleotide 2'-phosphodiesterase (5'-nucleotidase family)
MRSRVLLVASVLVLGASLTACAQPRLLTILHTNDMHASFVPREAIWVKETPTPMVGGFKQVQFAIDSIRKGRQDVLVLDAGDVMTGNPITERVFRKAQGGALFEMMNMIGYDAWCIGNHDLDISQENLADLMHVASFPTLSANLVNDEQKPLLGNRPYLIIERGGLKIGIIGVISQELYGLVLQTNLTGVRVLSPVETVQRYAEELAPKTDLIIALTHQGVDDDSALAAAVHGVDIIVGGHSHTRLKSPKIVNGVPIVQAGSNTEYLGIVDLVVDAHKIVKINGKLLPLWAATERPQTKLGAFVDSLQNEIELEYKEVIGVLKGDWVRKENNNTIGSYVTEVQREAVKADVCFMNTHGIRRDIPAGPITKRELFEALPFRNVIATFTLTGAQLQGVLTHAVEQRSSILVAGVTGEWTGGPGGAVELHNVRIGGKPIDMSRSYICAANDYLIGEAKRYLGLELPGVIYLQRTLFATVEEAIRRDKEIDPVVLPTLTRSR